MQQEALRFEHEGAGRVEWDAVSSKRSRRRLFEDTFDQDEGEGSDERSSSGSSNKSSTHGGDVRKVGRSDSDSEDEEQEKKKRKAKRAKKNAKKKRKDMQELADAEVERIKAKLAEELEKAKIEDEESGLGDRASDGGSKEEEEGKDRQNHQSKWTRNTETGLNALVGQALSMATLYGRCVQTYGSQYVPPTRYQE